MFKNFSQNWVKWATIIIVAYAFINHSTKNNSVPAIPKPMETPTTPTQQENSPQPTPKALSFLEKTLRPALEENLAKETASKEAPAPKVTDSKTLAILDVKKGSGAMVQCGQKIAIHYTASLPDHTIFDDTRKTNRPLSITLGKQEVIKGLEQGLVGMQPGGIRKLTIPSTLAYDDQAFKNTLVPAGSAVLFDVELLHIEPGTIPTQHTACGQ